MTVSEAINRADELRPNAVDESLKISELHKLDYEFANDMGAEIPEDYTEVTELIIPYPQNDVYVKFLCAQIDFINEETQLYQNDYIIANVAIADVKAWIRRNYMPQQKVKGWKVR